MPPAYSDLALLRRLAKWIRPYRLHIAGILLLSLLSTPLTLLTPVPLKIAVDTVIGSEPLPAFLDNVLPAAAKSTDMRLLVVATVLLLVTAILSQVQLLASSLLSTSTAAKLVLAFRAKLFRQLQRLSLSYHDSNGTSDSIYRLQYDASAVQYLVLDGLIPLATAIFTFVGMLYVTFVLDWQLALIALAISPPLFLVGRIFRPLVRNEARGVKRLESSAFSVVQEVLTSLRVVRAFGQEDREQERFVRQSDRSLRAKVRLAWAEGNLTLVLGLIVAVGTGAVLFLGVRNVIAGTLTLGELLLVMTYLAQLYRPLRTMSRKVAGLQRHLVGIERMLSVIDRSPDVPEKPDARPLSRTAGSLALHDVSFTYDGTDPVLREISLEIPAGARVGIMGETGSGKTTLVNLLSRFYDPTSGYLTLDGVDLREYRLADLRAQFAIVLQDPMLFSTTIAENISYADPNSSEETIVRAAKAANAHDFIVALPEGYDTQVGERGLRLSGGERQRIALARAFLKDAPIVIMDEPTSAVDVETEAGIIEAMNLLMQGRTCFLITHRESALAACDRKVVLKEGQLLNGTAPLANPARRAS
jgi:ATP-binding cassette subfamily B protein